MNLKENSDMATSGRRDFSLEVKEKVSSDASLIKTKVQEEFTSIVSKVEVSLVNAELWKELCEVGNEMMLHYNPR